MAVYSYTSSANLNITNGYPQDLLDIYPGYSASNYNEEKITFDYNEFSTYGPDSIDYGFINEVESFYDNYGDITEDIILPSQRENYGSITDNISIKPFGKLSTLGSFASDSLIRTSVGGVVFLLFGRCSVSFPSKYDGKSEIDIEGTSLIRFRLRYTSSGSILARSATLEEPASVSFHYRGSGTIGEISGAAESFRYNYTQAQGLFKFLGSAITFPIFYETTRAFDIVGNVDESVTYDYNETSRIDFNSDDYGFINEVVLRSEDYGLITEGEDIQRWDTRTEDHGLITEDITSIPYGLFRFDSTTRDSTLIPYTGSGTLKVQGEGFGRPTPRQLGGGFITLSGTPTVRIRLRYPGSGSLFGFSSTSEATVVQTEQQGTLKVNGHAEENFSKGNYTASGSVFSFVSATETTSPSQSISQSLFRIIGDAEIRIRMRYFASGSFFGFNGSSESATYSYNQSSTVDLDQDDYGFITEAESFQEDYGYIYDDPYPWQKFNYGFLTPDYTNKPFGLFKLISSTKPSASLLHIGSANLTVSGSAVPLFRLKVISDASPITLSGAVSDLAATFNNVGSGSIFTFISKTETATVSEFSTELFKFSGGVTNLKATFNNVGSGNISVSGQARIFVLPKHNGSGFIRLDGNAAESTTPATEIGSGSIFSFVSGTKSVSVTPPVSTQLFKFSGRATNLKATFSNVGSGTFRLGLCSPGLTGDGSRGITIFRLKVTETGRQPIVISGRAAESTTPTTHIGSGSIFSFISATESVAVTPPVPTELFKFSGRAIEKNSENYVGSGSIFTFKSTTQSRTLSEFSTVLFKFSGKGAESKTPATHVGKGSIFAFVSATESVAVTPPVSTQLFKFSGRAIERDGKSYAGSGSIFTFVSKTETRRVSEFSTELFKFSGNVVEKRRKSYDGKGSLFGFTSTTQSTTYSPSVPSVLFKISGRGAESTTPTTYIGSGSIFTFVSKTETRRVSEFSTELFKFSGSAIERNIDNYRGSGTITAFNNAVPIFRLRVISDGSLIKFGGNAKQAFGRASYSGFVEINIDGISSNRTVEYVSPKPPRIYVI